MSTITLKISGMHCDGCASRIMTVLAKEPGVHKASVSYPKGTAEIRFNERSLNEQRLVGVIERAGFDAAPI